MNPEGTFTEELDDNERELLLIMDSNHRTKIRPRSRHVAMGLVTGQLLRGVTKSVFLEIKINGRG